VVPFLAQCAVVIEDTVQAMRGIAYIWCIVGSGDALAIKYYEARVAFNASYYVAIL
jgi:hypothetical protein